MGCIRKRKNDNEMKTVFYFEMIQSTKYTGKEKEERKTKEQKKWEAVSK